MQEAPRPPHLQPEETVLRQEGRHLLSILDDVLLVLVGVVGLGWLAAWLFQHGEEPYRSQWLEASLYVWSLLGAFLLLYVTLRVRRAVTSRYLITDERVYASHGVLRFTLTQTTYDKVTDLHIRQSMFGRLLGFGTLNAETAGAGISLAGVRDPFAVKRDLETARTAFIARLVAQHKAAARVRARAARAEAAAPRVLPPGLAWNGRPVAASMIGRFLSGGLMILVGVSLLGLSTRAADANPLLRFAPFFLLGVGALTLVRAWILLRYTRYEVTEQGLVVTAGWLGRSRVETRYEKVTHVTTHQSLLGRLLDYGNILANTAGGLAPPIQFQGVADPGHVKQLIEAARDAKAGRGARA